MAIDYTMIGKRLKESRMAAKLTQEKVAEAADITTVYLSKIENGKVTPTLDTLGAVCAAVNADLGYVLVRLSVQPEDLRQRNGAAAVSVLHAGGEANRSGGAERPCRAAKG